MLFTVHTLMSCVDFTPYQTSTMRREVMVGFVFVQASKSIRRYSSFMHAKIVYLLDQSNPSIKLRVNFKKNR